MAVDVLLQITKIYALIPYEYHGNRARARIGTAYKLHVAGVLGCFLILSIYVRIYTSTKRFLHDNGKLTLKNYIYLVNATLTIGVIFTQFMSNYLQRFSISRLVNRLRDVTDEDLNTKRFTNIPKCLFILSIIIILFYINCKVHTDWIMTVCNFINETILEMASFTDVFVYYERVGMLTMAFKTLSQRILHPEREVRAIAKGNKNIQREYLDLCSIAHELDRLHRVNVAVISGFIFLWITFDAYMFCKVWTDNPPTKVKDFTRCAPWLVLHTIKLAVLVAQPPRCKYYGNEAAILLMQPKYDHSKWFVVDYQFFASMFGTVITYMAILYQFSDTMKEN